MLGRISVVAMCVHVYAIPVQAADWTPIADKLGKSVVYVETAKGSCTAFVINSHATNKDKEDVDYLLTAAHCDGAALYADQTPAKVLWKDQKKDLMVLEVADLGRPALKLATSNPKVGQDVLSFGYGYGLERPMARIAHVADDATYIPEDGIGGPFIVTDAAFVSGQSGGPCVDAAGDVVMIVQRGSSIVGLGVGAETIKGKAGKYFERTRSGQ